MKLTVVACLLFITLSASFAGTEEIDVDFRGILDQGDSHIFSLGAEDGKTAWVAEGDTFAGYEVGEFRADENVLILLKDGEEYSLSLGSAGITRGNIKSDDARVDVSNLRQIGQASLIFANDNREGLPGGEEVETIHDVARLLAQKGGLNDATMWVSKHDAKSGSEDRLTTVLDSNRRESLDPVFADQDVVAFDFVTGLDTGMPSTTPIAWTRGLRQDGTWDKKGPHGSSGGFIVFMGGNVMTEKELSEGGGRLVGRDGNRTSNILGALPPGARVVGSGPGTLHGATGGESGEGGR